MTFWVLPILRFYEFQVDCGRAGRQAKVGLGGRAKCESRLCQILAPSPSSPCHAKPDQIFATDFCGVDLSSPISCSVAWSKGKHFPLPWVGVEAAPN